MLLSRLSSLRLTVLLLAVLIALCLAGMADDRVFSHWYFAAALALFGANLLACCASGVARLPGTGLFVLHLSVPVILLGGLVTAAFREQGFLAFEKGEVRPVGGAPGARGGAGLAVRLDDFTVERYDGGERAGAVKGFRSSVSIIEDGSVAAREDIEVNRPFRYGGYVFYQAGYDPERPGWSGLQVVRDPGAGIAFLGFALLNAGAVLTVLARVRAGAKKDGGARDVRLPAQ